jgi:hypothetical protein
MDIRINSGLNGVETAICLQGLNVSQSVIFVTGYSVDDFPVKRSIRMWFFKTFFRQRAYFEFASGLGEFSSHGY